MIGASRFNRSVGDHKTPFMAGKERELFESKKWPSLFSRHVDITKVRIDAFKPWINKRITELMGVEDDIVVDYCISQLKVLGETDAKANTENAGDGGTVLNEKPYLDPKKLQINLTGFMAKKAHVFVKELWDLLLSAQENEYGIPQKFIDEKRREITELENNAGSKTEITERGADSRGKETDHEKTRHESPSLSSRRDENLSEKRARAPSNENVWYKDKKYTESLRNPNRRYNRYSKYNRYRRPYNRYSRSRSSSSSRSSDYRRNRRRKHSRSNSPYYRKHSDRRRYSSSSSSLTPGSSLKRSKR